MKNIAIVTDSNSGITQKEAELLGINVLPMPFFIDGELYFEDINLTQDEFYKMLENDADISTSQPSPGEVMDLWDKLLDEYMQVLYIPMSSGLSSSYSTAAMLAEDDYEGRVFVVNNQRISVTQKLAVLDSIELSKKGYDGDAIKKILEASKFDSSIYITLETLKYLKKGGRITPAAATLGTLLNIKPVLQIQGEKLDSFAKSRGKKAAKKIMLEAIERDINERFSEAYKNGYLKIAAAYTGSREDADEWLEEIKSHYPDADVFMDPLSLSVSCHIGSGAIAIACSELPKELR
ncbi:MAG: DegV family protein [Lachnospiraceae bacterium]|nr:DegV family protein [Lachnospiraceae bacterium]